MDRIFCISGMGADERIFEHLHVPGYEIVPVKWVPISPDDDLSSYAQKLSLQVTDANPILLGLSLGGMLAVEVGKILSASKIFLISSAKTTAELPWIGRKKIAHKLVDIIPEGLYGKAGYFGFNFGGAKSKEERRLLSAMIQATPKGFIKQTLKSVLSWNNTAYPPNIIQIHGTADHIIPASNVHPTHWIKGGGHIMIYNRAPEICKIISDNLPSPANE